jgi:hypothetical protein
MVWILGALFFALVALNVLVSAAVARSGYFTRGQVLAQAVLVWLVPLIGAVIVGTFLWSELHSGKRRSHVDEPGEPGGLDGTVLPDGTHAGGGHAP